MLTDAFPIYWHLRQRFEQRNGLYFHALLLVTSAAYFGGVPNGGDGASTVD